MKKYIIPIIKKQKEAEANKQLQLPLPLDPAPEYEYKEKIEEKPKRGSAIIDFNIDKENCDE